MEEDIGKLIMRLMVGGLLLFHGVHKVLNGIEPIKHLLAAQGAPDWLAYGVYLGEVVGPILVILGLLSRVGGLFIAINMLVAIAMVHRHYGLFANWSGTQKGEGFEFHLLVLAIVLAIIVRGAGALSLDRAIHRWLA